jgi:hypothetical protein
MKSTNDIDPLKVLERLFKEVLKNGRIPQAVIIFLLAMFATGILVFTTMLTEVAIFLLIWRLVQTA